MQQNRWVSFKILYALLSRTCVIHQYFVARDAFEVNYPQRQKHNVFSVIFFACAQHCVVI